MATSSRDSSQRWFPLGRSLEQDSATADRANGTIGAPVAGVCTYGEIARPHGYHNRTLAVLAVG